jgi:3-phosphoshikimate 1-carboxyvinyltransferase
MIAKKFNLKVKDKILPFNKSITVDADKSISIRSFLIGSICNNISKASNVLESGDVFSTINCLKKLGVKILKQKAGKYLIYGKGLGSLYAKKNTKLFFGNSGTLARLIIGILSTTPGINIKINGDHSLNKRNMKSLIYLMSKFGANFWPKKKYNFPLKLTSSQIPVGTHYNAGVSAQLKSAVILAGLNSYGVTKIVEVEKSRDHTENILKINKKVLKIKDKKKRIIEVFGKKKLNSINIQVPNDPSSAAFFSALTLLNKKSSLVIKNVGLNTKRIGFYQLLKKQGANIKFKNLRKKNNEISGDILIKSHKLRPIYASKSYYTIMTDEYPILFVISALIKGVSTFKGIKDLTNKESNRIKEMQKVLAQINIKSKFLKDGFKIYGQGMIDASNKSIEVPNLGDHRICMSTFVLALLTGAKTNIKNFETVFTSSPSFLKVMKLLGAKFEIQKK